MTPKAPKAPQDPSWQGIIDHLEELQEATDYRSVVQALGEVIDAMSDHRREPELAESEIQERLDRAVRAVGVYQLALGMIRRVES